MVQSITGPRLRVVMMRGAGGNAGIGGDFKDHLQLTNDFKATYRIF